MTGIVAALADGALVFPAIIGSGGTVLPTAALAPAVVAVLCAMSMRARSVHLAEGATRRLTLMDGSLVVAAAILVAIPVLAVPGADVTVLRNALLCLGLVAGAGAVVSPAAASSIVAVVVLFCLTYGTSAPGGSWVRILQAPAEQVWPWVASSIVFVVGVLACATLPPRSAGIDDAS